MSTSTQAAPPGAATQHGGIGLTRLKRLARSTETTPRWEKVSFGAVLLLALFLTLWGLSKNGYSNTYYAAAVKSASISWKALFFGSLDPSSFITVDKPPLAIWLMGISTRIFGFSSFAMLMPQALCTVGAVALLHATVKRVAGTPAALAAALALALTPITIAIARVNNPDALMILLMVGAGYLLVRALESGKTKFLAWCGVLVGLAFMTKMLQGWMVLPAFAITYFAFGPGKLARRTWQLLVAAFTTAVVSAAWPVAVTLWPGSKPFIGGSTNGSVWNLILGYNGLGRITGNESGAGGGGGSPTFGGSAGWLRMFNAEVGAQIAWLLPLAAISLIAGLWLTRKAERTNLRRAGIVMFGLWLVVHFAIFSTQEGIFHPYYTSAMAPAIAALCGIGVVMLFQAAKKSWVALGVLDLSIAGTAWLAMDLMGRATDAPGWAKIVVPAGAVVSIGLSPLIRSEKLSARRLVAVAAVAGSLALVAGPASYSFANVGRSLNGNNVLAGPAGASSGGFGGMGGGAGGRGGFGGGTPPSGGNFGGGTPPSGASGSFTPPSGATGTAPSGATGTATTTGTGTTGTASSATTGTGASATGTTATGTGSTTTATTGTQTGGPGGAGGAAGGMGGGSSLSTAAIKYLEANQGSAKYLVAATGSQTTASIILATGKNVVTIGGFSGSDPAPTVSQLAAMVKSGELKYVLVGGQGGMGGRGGSSDITSWVEAHGTAVTAVTTTSGTLYKVTA